MSGVCVCLCLKKFLTQLALPNNLLPIRRNITSTVRKYQSLTPHFHFHDPSFLPPLILFFKMRWRGVGAKPHSFLFSVLVPPARCMQAAGRPLHLQQSASNQPSKLQAPSRCRSDSPVFPFRWLSFRFVSFGCS